MEVFTALWEYPFLQHALIGGLLASIGCGIIGSYVVVKRIGFMAGGISHSVLGGMGIAFFIGASPLGGALVAAVTVVLLIQVVGLILVIALFTLSGLFISYTPDLPAGATIILVAGVTYMISLLYTTGRKRRDLRRQLTKVVQ
ncbi:metal ABC transporter permease [Sedimenticola thiotaurini]